MRFQAHRGVSTEYPENTLPAFKAAYEQGYQIIELDPAFTKDEKCVVIHDPLIGRTLRKDTGERPEHDVLVSELTFEEIRSFDAGLFKGEQFRGTKVPLLSEVLAFAEGKELTVKIDNRFEDFTEEQQEILFSIVENSTAAIAFTCKSPEGVKMVTGRFENAEIHYDGAAEEDTLKALKSSLKKNPFTVWLPLPSQLTSWVRVPMANAELCNMVKQYADLGLWILETELQYEMAKALDADVIETTGAIKPQKEKE